MKQKQGNNSELVGYRMPPASHRFTSGQSGNPAGRPKGRSVTALLRQVVEANDGELAERLVRVLIQRALDGDFRAMQEIWNRLEGKPRQQSPDAGSGVMEIVIHRVESAKAIED